MENTRIHTPKKPIVIKVSPKVYVYLKKLKAKYGCSFDFLIRKFIMAYVAEEKEKYGIR